jgi:hypothetical protein
MSPRQSEKIAEFLYRGSLILFAATALFVVAKILFVFVELFFLR